MATIPSPGYSTSEPQYNITIRNSDTKTINVYRTIEVTPGAKALRMVGRETRVWKTQRVENEHVLRQEIHKKHPGYSQFFLTHVDHDFAPSEFAEPSILANAHKPQRRKRDLRPTGTLSTHPWSPSNTASSIVSSTSRDNIWHLKYISKSFNEGYCSSRHSHQSYPIAFEEISKPVHDLSEFTSVFTAVQGAWDGLNAIHLCSYVYRDMSSGNILLAPDSSALSKRGVLIDLEYTKLKDTKALHEEQVGTDVFMATEVILMEHHWLSELRSSWSLPNSVEELRLQAMDGFPWETPLPRFHHNPLHDMESIWWLCIWMMFRLVTSEDSAPERLNSYRRVFKKHDTKRCFFCYSIVFNQHTSHLSELQPLVTQMGLWRNSLNSIYDISYKQQYTSATSLTMIEINSRTIQASYRIGNIFLQGLHDASKQLLIESM